jgi:hypothetical protein
MNRTIKEIQKAPRYQCKFTLHRVVKGKVACTGWSKFLHRAKNGTHNNFDDSDLDLTQAFKDLLAQNTYAQLDRVAKSNEKLEKYREIDDILLNLLYSTQTAAVKEILNSNALTAAFITLPPTSIDRPEKYFEILSNQFFKGNSCANINKITNQTQDLDETEAAWTNHAYEHYNRVEPILPLPRPQLLSRSS